MPLRSSAAVLIGLLLSTAPALAHHSPTAMYNMEGVITLSGKIIKVAWTNPHSVFHVEVTAPDGKKVLWEIQTSTPNALLRRGVTMDALPPGTPITLAVHQARDGSNNGIAQKIVFSDGRSSELDVR
jgi:hypothetical protein